MKNPLGYQSTEYDCGPTTLLNAINFLFHREEISPDIVKGITTYCLDGYNTKGEAYKSGTSLMAMMFLSNWLNQFGRVRKWPIYTEVVTGREVDIRQNSQIVSALQQGGVVIVKCMLGVWHYVLLTGIDDKYVYLFDPYYRRNPFKEEGIIMVKDEPTKYNRKVTHDILNSFEKKNYAMGHIETRESVILFNQKTRQTVDSIEYVI